MLRKRLVEICEALSLLDENEISIAVQILKAAKNRGNFVWIAGNGGSAATSAHFANDLLKMCHIKAIDVGGMTPTVTAFGNDHGWERMYANTIKALINPGDVIILISCSGNSKNILEVANEFQSNHDIIVLTGTGDGELARKNTSACIKVMSDDITVQEDVHSIVCHEIARSIANG